MTQALSSQRSRWSLDALAFLVPDVQGGVGPFLIVFMSSALAWDPQRIGMVLSLSALAGLAAQAPAGALVDRSAHAPRWIAAALAVIAACLAAMARWPTYGVILLGQSLIGVAGAVIGPAIAAVSLGVMGRRGLDARIGRNAALSGAGTVVWALGTGWLAHRHGARSMFFFAIALAAPTILAALLIRKRDMDPGAVHGAEVGKRPVSLGKPWHLPGLRLLMACAFLFHLANAAMLTLVAQRVGERGVGGAALWLSSGVVITQLVSIPPGLALSRWAPGRARRPLFLAAFATLAVRGVCYLLVDGPAALLALQVLDGAGACLFGVMLTLVIGDLTQARGHFGLALGMAGTSVGLGAAASNLVAGHLAHLAGTGTAFAMLALIACVALALFAARMPETASAHPDTPPHGAHPSTLTAS